METRDQILSVARDYFFKFGIRSVTMDDLAKEMGISKKTLYLYFEDKDALVREMCEMHMVEERAKAQRIHASAQNPLEELIIANEMLSAAAEKINPALIIDIKKHHQDAWKISLKHKEYIKEIIVNNLNRGKEMGIYRSELNADIIAQLRMVVVESSLEGILFSTDYKVTEIQKHVFDHFIHGLLTDKGKNLYNELRTNKSLTYV